MTRNHSVTVTKVIDADRQTIFEALTDADIMERWFYAGPDGWSATVVCTPEVGQSFQVEMHGPEATYAHVGFFKEIIENRKLVFSWNSQYVENTTVTITLAEVDGGTEVKLVHELIPSEEEAENHRNGWTSILERLAGVVVSQA